MYIHTYIYVHVPKRLRSTWIGALWRHMFFMMRVTVRESERERERQRERDRNLLYQSLTQLLAQGSFQLLVQGLFVAAHRHEYVHTTTTVTTKTTATKTTATR